MRPASTRPRARGTSRSRRTALRLQLRLQPRERDREHQPGADDDPARAPAERQRRRSERASAMQRTVPGPLTKRPGTVITAPGPRRPAGRRGPVTSRRCRRQRERQRLRVRAGLAAASLAAIGCWNSSVTASLLIGAAQSAASAGCPRCSRTRCSGWPRWSPGPAAPAPAACRAVDQVARAVVLVVDDGQRRVAGSVEMTLAVVVAV